MASTRSHGHGRKIVYFFYNPAHPSPLRINPDQIAVPLSAPLIIEITVNLSGLNRDVYHANLPFLL